MNSALTCCLAFLVRFRRLLMAKNQSSSTGGELPGCQALLCTQFLRRCRSLRADVLIHLWKGFNFVGTDK